MSDQRRICVVTGTRADYGLLYWLLREIDDDPALKLQLVVTGMHLAPEFGYTVDAIERDSFEIAARVDSLLASNTEIGVCKSVGLGVIGFADAFARLAPDILVILGDRYEIFAAAQSAMLCNIPIAHIHGGEVTQGAIDDAIRHAITKMAHFHFVASRTYARRVIRMGENPDRVWTVGAPALDNIARLQLLSAGVLATDVGLPDGGPLFLVTFHPVTRSRLPVDSVMGALQQALDQFPTARVLITKANADTQGARVNALWEEYVRDRPGRARLVASLGQLRYLSAVKHASVVIGNSSSGLVEAPALGTPTVNIGDRQQGRLRSQSVVDCGETVTEIVAAIREALSPEFAAMASSAESVYGVPGASALIKELLKSVSLENVLMKDFYDGVDA